MKAVLDIDDPDLAETTFVVHDTDDPCGAFVAGRFIPLLRTVDGWAFVHDLEAVEMPSADQWFTGELLGRPARGRWEP